MKCTCIIDDLEYFFDTDQCYDLSIGLKFNEEQPSAYGIAPATSAPYVAGDYVGDTRQGGACNFDQLVLVPHANGTHTESIGHLTDQRITINHVIDKSLIPSLLITVQPRSTSETTDSYDASDTSDMIICMDDIRQVVQRFEKKPMEAIIIRTLPNRTDKKQRSYQEERAAFFSNESIRFLSDLPVKHLLVDLPSIDRDKDGGKLPNHRVYWNLGESGHKLTGNSRMERTITEFIFVPDEAPDGHYLLNLQVAPFESDAAPSRPLIYPLEKT